MPQPFRTRLGIAQVEPALQRTLISSSDIHIGSLSHVVLQNASQRTDMPCNFRTRGIDAIHCCRLPESVDVAFPINGCPAALSDD